MATYFEVQTSLHMDRQATAAFLSTGLVGFTQLTTDTQIALPGWVGPQSTSYNLWLTPVTDGFLLFGKGVFRNIGLRLFADIYAASLAGKVTGCAEYICTDGADVRELLVFYQDGRSLHGSTECLNTAVPLYNYRTRPVDFAGFQTLLFEPVGDIQAAVAAPPQHYMCSCGGWSEGDDEGPICNGGLSAPASMIPPPPPAEILLAPRPAHAVLDAPSAVTAVEALLRSSPAGSLREDLVARLLNESTQTDAMWNDTVDVWLDRFPEPATDHVRATWVTVFDTAYTISCRPVGFRPGSSGFFTVEEVAEPTEDSPRVLETATHHEVLAAARTLIDSGARAADALKAAKSLVAEAS